MDTTALWEKFKADGDRKSRDVLILQYRPLIKYVASKMSSGLPNSVEQDDLEAYGMFGLIDAIDKFEPDRGFKFETYAVSRIRGSIYDELRSMDWVPRSVRARAKELQVTTSHLESSLKRKPTRAEIAYAMDLTEEKVSELQHQAASANVSLDEFVPGMDDTVTLAETISDNNEAASSPLIESIGAMVDDITDAMPIKEKIVLALYYYDGLTLADIGKVLGVTESRVCQIHTKAVLNLRSMI
jgi:RNA polymerase sigma factor FliA